MLCLWRTVWFRLSYTAMTHRCKQVQTAKESLLSVHMESRVKKKEEAVKRIYLISLILWSRKLANKYFIHCGSCMLSCDVQTSWTTKQPEYFWIQRIFFCSFNLTTFLMLNCEAFEFLLKGASVMTRWISMFRYSRRSLTKPVTRVQAPSCQYWLRDTAPPGGNRKSAFCSICIVHQYFDDWVSVFQL